jgi:hypothetical protein
MASQAGASPIREPLQRPKDTLAGVFYLLTFATAIPALFLRGSAAIAAGLIAGACYVVVTLLFYSIFKPVSRALSLLAMVISLAAIATGPLSQFHVLPRNVNPLVFFGLYCLLIGYLIVRSTFLPHALGVLMAFAGCGWLTFLSLQLANRLYPYNLIPGCIGEGSLTVWLLIKGVNIQRWNEQQVR